MLYSYFGRPYVADKQPIWIDQDFIRLVDKTKLRDGMCARITEATGDGKLLNDLTIENQYRGLISLDELSGTAKCLILMYTRPDLVMRSAKIADNCAGVLKYMSDHVDCHLLIDHAFRFDPEQVFFTSRNMVSLFVTVSPISNLELSTVMITDWSKWR